MVNNLRRLLVTQRRFLTYAAVGGLCALIDLALLYLFTEFLGIWYITSSVLSFIATSLLSYLLNKHVTFGDRQRRGTIQYIKYTGIIFLGLVINTAILYGVTEMIGLWYVFSRVISSSVALFWNYKMSKAFIFNRKTV